MIVNIKKSNKYDLYIGRENKGYGVEDSIFKNPYVIGKNGTRAEVIQKFRETAPLNKELMDNLYLIDDKVLGCWCDWPQEDCHGNVLIELRTKQKKDMEEKKLWKVAVIGSRSVTDRKLIFDFLDEKYDKIEMIISGGASGPDSFAQDWAKERGFPCLTYYPRWHSIEGEYDKGAGFKRNYLIVKDSDVVVAFYDGISKGTANSIELAKKYGKQLIVKEIKEKVTENKDF